MFAQAVRVGIAGQALQRVRLSESNATAGRLWQCRFLFSIDDQEIALIPQLEPMVGCLCRYVCLNMSENNADKPYLQTAMILASRCILADQIF